MNLHRGNAARGFPMAALFTLSVGLCLQPARAQEGLLEEVNRSLAAGRELGFEVQDEVAEARYLAGVDDDASRSHAARARELYERARASLEAVRDRVERGRSSGDLGESTAAALLGVCDRHRTMLARSMVDLSEISAGAADPAPPEPAGAAGTTPAETAPPGTTPPEPAPGATDSASGEPVVAEPEPKDWRYVRLSEQDRDRVVGIMDRYREEIAGRRESFERAYADPGAALRTAMDARGLPQDIDLNAWANSLLCRVLDVKNWYQYYEGQLRERRDLVSARSRMEPDAVERLETAMTVWRGYEATLLTALQAYVDARADLTVVYVNKQDARRTEAESLLAEREQAVLDITYEDTLLVQRYTRPGNGSESRSQISEARRAKQGEGLPTGGAGEGPEESFLDRLRSRHTVSDERLEELSRRPGDRALMEMIHQRNVGRPMLENMLRQGGDITLRTRPDEEMADREAVYDPADRSLTVPARRLNADGSLDDRAPFQGEVLREMWDAYNDQTVAAGNDPLTRLVLDETKEWLREQPVLAGDGRMKEPVRAADVVTDFDRLAGEYVGGLLTDLAPRHISLMQRLPAGGPSGSTEATRDAYRQWDDFLRHSYGADAGGGAVRNSRPGRGEQPPSFTVQSRPPRYLIDHLSALAGLGDFAGDR